MEYLLHHTPVLYLIQSFWRDEAFSVILAGQPLSTLFHVTFEPPFYYILLHFWIKIFGTGEIAVRSLSLTGFALSCYIITVWSGKIFKKHWLSWYFPLFFFVNPMLLYYAFEARAYGWYMFFTVASLYAYVEQKWTWYVAATVFGLYTHTYMAFVPVVELLHYLTVQKRILSFTSIKKVIRDPMILSVAVITIAYSPWIAKIITELPRLQKSWYFPVDAHLMKSVLANIFLGYEGTPDFLWPLTAKLSILIAVFMLFALFTKKHLVQNGLFFLLAVLPLSIVLTISIYKPIFVNRYLIPSVIGEIFLIAAALANTKNAVIQKTLAAVLFGAVIWFNLWYPAYNKKQDIRSVIVQINALRKANDVILVDDARTLYEAVYYSADKRQVYWYNPNEYPFPWYIGDAIYSKSQSVNELPPYPIRAFLVRLDGSFEISYRSQITPVIKTTGSKQNTIYEQ